MAERRMFCKKIINSAKFLKMPNETQNLYFHLGLNADDDGIVEAFTTMRLIGATEDSLRILAAKGFIHVLNDDLVSFITDWTEHNKIRSDRKVDSIYKDLLISVIPNVELLESRDRADRKKVVGRPTDNQVTDNGQHRLGKVRLGKVRLGEGRLGKDKESSNKFSDGSIELSLSMFLYDLVNKNIKTKKPNFTNWAKHIDLMLRVDNRNVEDIKAVITWSQNDDFWKSNIRSTKKLREKFETLFLQMNNKSKSYNKQNKESDMEQLQRLYLQMETEEEANG